MKILITGSQGYIGNHIYQTLKNEGKDVLGVDRVEGADLQVDITNSTFESFLFELKPDVIVHTAALKDLKYCEENRYEAWEANVGPSIGILNYAKSNSKVKVIYISSDVIYDGLKGNYKTSDTPNPINWYGSTKLQNEIILKIHENTAIMRTALVYGDLTPLYSDLLRNELNNEILLNQSLLPHYIYNRLSKNKTVKLPDNIISSPTYLVTLARGILNAIDFDLKGIYHLAGSEIISRYGFAVKVANFHKLDEKLIEKDERAILSYRPKNVGMDIDDSYDELKLKKEDWGVDAVLKKINWKIV
jgi:dTDP-4-dehydrorhamnose reductase